ncbi:MAG: flagellar biosynthetic protein FliO [Candidatus Desulfofervidaceae bacterium]|nr:flagellar biosynthetic protein FliO [Candidatus Desulfofervidaceae bacterium]MDL1969687.1 flagellar biosynthetic protein FliO [Candidatus Desulfofervidaceae bacterium]
MKLVKPGLIFIIVGFLWVLNVQAQDFLNTTKVNISGSDNFLEDVKIVPDKAGARIKLFFKKPIGRKDFRIRYNELVSVDLYRTSVKLPIEIFPGITGIKGLFAVKPNSEKVTIYIPIDKLCKELFKRVKIANYGRALVLAISNSDLISEAEASSPPDISPKYEENSVRKEDTTFTSIDSIRKEILSTETENLIGETLNKYTSPLPSERNQKEFTLSVGGGFNKKEEDLPKSPSSVLFKSFSALFVVLGILLTSFWGWKKIMLLKQRGLKGADNTVKILGMHHFSPRQMIAIVEIGGQRLVLGVTPEHITTLTKLDTDTAIGANQPAEFALNFQKEATKVEDTMSKAVNVLKKKIGQLRKI